MSAKVTKTFSGTGTSDSTRMIGKFNVSVQGTFSGTVQLQRRFGGEGDWEATDSFTEATSGTAEEPESDVEYRFECTAYTSGTITCRIGK